MDADEQKDLELEAMAPAFEVNEKVLAEHNGLIYEAKILKSILEDGIYKHLIHYAGWNKHWDEWAGEVILLKYNDENLEKQRILKEEKQKTTKKRVSLKAKSKSLTGSGKRKRIDAEDNNNFVNTNVNDPETSINVSNSSLSYEAPSNIHMRINPVSAAEEESEELPSEMDIPKDQSLQNIEKVDISDAEINEQQSNVEEETGVEEIKEGEVVVNPISQGQEPREYPYQQYQEVKIEIPSGLKKVLVDDWFEIRKKNKVINLPIDPSRNMDAIFHDFESFSEKTWRNIELCEGFRDYIEGILRNKLLYKDEKAQNVYFNEQIQSKNLNLRKEYSRIYGGIHLIRLMTQLGHCLSYYPLDDYTRTYLEESITEFSVFLESKLHDYLKPEDYVPKNTYNYTFYNTGSQEYTSEEQVEVTEG